MMDFIALLGIKDRVALVVGAGSGHGRAAALLLANCGARVIFADKNEAALSESLSLVGESERGNCYPMKVDIAEIAECRNLIAEVDGKFKRIDILIQTAAILEPVEIMDVDEEHWQRTLDINLKSQYFLAQSVVPIMQRNNWGRIVNFVSTAGITGGLPASSVYGISKAGALAMTKTFARQFARDNILVNALSPSSLLTPLWKRGLDEEELNRRINNLEQNSLFGRWTPATDVATATLFLASNLCNAVTGHLLRADSGAELSAI